MSKVLYTFFVGTCAFLCLGIVLCTTPVVAKNDGHGRDGDKERSRHSRDHDEDEHGRSGAQGYHHSNHGIHDSDAYIIRKYLTDNHHRRCPPGLAKKRNGCLPPGIAKKYAVGQVLNDGIWSPVPEALRPRYEGGGRKKAAGRKPPGRGSVPGAYQLRRTPANRVFASSPMR